MNYKNNLSLILASTMVSGMFSAAVNATAYKFNNTTGNLAVHAVSNKNVVALENSDSIALALSASENPSQKFAFSVSDDVVNENAAKATGNANLAAEDVATVKELKDKAAEATTALTNAAKAGQAAAANVETYAKAFRDAVEVMAKIKGKMSDKSNAQELVAAVKDLVLAEANAYKAATNAGAAAVANNTFKSSNLPAGEEDAGTVTARVQRALANGLVAGLNGANTPVKMGICVGDVVTGIPENDERKYQVIGSAQIAGNVDLEGAAGAAVAPLSIDNAERISDADFGLVPAGAIGNGLVIVNAAGGRIGANNAVNGAIPGLTGKVQAFFENRTHVDQGNPANGQRIIEDIGKVAQLNNFNAWMNNYFMYRAKAFLAAAEEIPAGATNASWLGAGSVKNLNSAGDYTVTVALKKGSDAVAVRKITSSKLTLGGENGAAVTPLVVEFVPKTVTKETTVDGTLKITSAGKTQEIKVEGTIAKSGAADIDPSAEQTVVSGYKYTKENTKAIRENGGDDEFVLNVLPTGAKIEEPVTITLAKAKTMKTGAQTITATISEDDNANALYAEEDKEGKKKNDVAIFSTGSISTGKVEYGIPVEVAKEELGELDNGAKVYVYLTTTEKLEATKEKKAAAKKAETKEKKTEAKASASDGAVDSTKVIEGKVVDGKIVFTEDPSKVTREDGEVFMISKNKLNIEDAEEASAAEDKEDEEEEEEEEDAEDEEEEEKKAEETATTGAATAATAGNDALTTEATAEGTAVDEVTANKVPAAEEVSANAANGVAATGTTAAAGIFGTMALASLAAGALATKKNKK